MSIKLLKQLMSSSNPESRKKGERLLKSGNLHFLYQEGDNLNAVFHDTKAGRIKTLISLDGENSDCECEDEAAWCIHKTAASMHFLKCSDMLDSNPLPKPGYGGLKSDTIDKLFANPGVKEGRAEVWIEEEPPHAPSKWGKCILSVKLFFGKREYSGNMNNLRQLNFGKGIGSGLSIEEFSSQEKQIIRFLSLNAEPDGQKLELDADTTAELFHCLIGFERCFYNRPFNKESGLNQRGLNNSLTSEMGYSSYSKPVKNNFFVHGESAEIVLSYNRIGEILKLQPALMTGSGLKPVKDFRMLAGRSGCWIGVGADYWWQPGIVDLMWLRSFILSGTGKYSEGEASRIISNAGNNGVKVVKSKLKNSLSTKKCIPSYNSLFDADKQFQLNLKFVYGDQIFPTGGPNTSGSGKYGWKRDRKQENAYEAELLTLGFRKNLDIPSLFTLDSPENAALFIDKVVTKWYAEKREMLFSADFADLVNGGHGIPELAFSCSIVDENPSTVELSYSISAGNRHSAATWKEILNLIKKGKLYLYKQGEIVGKLEDKLIKFVSATADFTQIDKENDEVLRIPKSTLIYWGQEFEKLTELLPLAVKELQAELKPENPDNLHKAHSEQVKQPRKIKYFKGNLRSYQEEGVKWIRKMLDNNLNSILADEMGLGKTIQTIALLCKNKEEFPESPPSLVVCPSSLVENWQIEFSKFAPDFEILMLKGIKRKQYYPHLKDADVIITSYSIAGRDIEELKKHRFKYVILDEAQHIKNPSTVNAVTSKAIDSEYKLVLTGTPLENTPQELWSIFDFLHPKMLGSLNAFKNRYSGIHTDESMQHDLAARTAPFILRRKKDDVEPDLPNKVVQTLYCDMNPKQRQIYEDFREEGMSNFGKLVKSGKNSRFDLFTNLLRLRQICCHPMLLANAGMDDPQIESAKTDLLQELLLESIDSGHKVLVFSQFTSFLAIIRKWLVNRQIPFEYLDGSTKERLTRVNNFNNSPDIPVFLLSLRAGGVGLNLTSADRVIIYDPWWNPAVEAQATDRTHRIGQKRSVLSMKLVVKDSIEEKILKLQEQKQKIFQNLVENQSTSLKSLSDEDLEFLLT
jgi:superfamily II DNA or RNA helicase